MACKPLTLLVALVILASCGQRDGWRVEDWPAAEQSDVRVDHGLWQDLLDRYLVHQDQGLNRFDYARLRDNDASLLDTYLNRMSEVQLARLSRDEQMAYWINLYNALTVREITKAYPVASILELQNGDGPWKTKVFQVANRSLSLDDIEHKLLRGLWQEPRIHFAVNCASIGCPDVRPKAFSGHALEQDLSAAARAYLASARGVSVNDDQLILSSLFDWYATDFGDNATQVRQTLANYADETTAATLRQWQGSVDFAYDWALNDVEQTD
ncbi:MAG: DUF547 domain-containing protein [Woeseiaceae bacterium]